MSAELERFMEHCQHEKACCRVGLKLSAFASKVIIEPAARRTGLGAWSKMIEAHLGRSTPTLMSCAGAVVLLTYTVAQITNNCVGRRSETLALVSFLYFDARGLGKSLPF